MTLYVVATPIGNLEDMTHRAVRVLGEVDTVLAEDTRQTRKLLSHYNLTTPVQTVHQHTNQTQLDKLADQLAAGKNFALVTDAGTPGVSDPGGQLVATARLAGVEVVPIPGPSAVTTLLSVAGIPTDSFLFIGFLPKKKGRQTLWQELAGLDVPIVIFESPHRIIKTLEDILEHLGDRRVIVGRELTKLHEEVFDATATEAMAHWQGKEPKGEFVLIVAPGNQ